MGFVNDISNWAYSIHKYSIDLITYGKIFEYNDLDNKIGYTKNYNEIRSTWIKEKDPIMDVFWLSFCTGVECLCKAVLIQHECLKISKRNILNKYEYPGKKYFKSEKEFHEYYNHIYGSVYRTASKEVVARKNKWLQRQLEENEIKYITEINTPTLGFIYNYSFQKLYKLNVINADELHKLEKGIETFTDIRRNVDTHVYLTRRVVGSIQDDIENIYIPVINLLLKIFKRVK